MKFVAIPLLLCVVFAPAAMCSVEVVAIQPSSERPLITVKKDGVVQPGAQIAVSGQNGKPKLSMTSDSRGTVRLPRVRSGIYCIVASTSPTLRADLCLQIANENNRTPSAFAMDLAVKPPPPPTLEERIAAAAHDPATVRSCEFAGVVVDPAGAFIPRVSIVVRQQSNGSATHQRKIVSDQHGRFAAALRPGRYTAVFSILGFATQIQNVEIAPDTGVHDLRVTMQVGPVS